VKILTAADSEYLIEYEGVTFRAWATDTGVDVDGGFDNLAAETNTHPEDLFDLIMETIFDKEAKCQR